VARRGSLLLAGGALLALALLAALSWGSATAEAVFPGQNGRIACQGLRGPNPAPVGESRTKIFSVNPDGSDERVLSNTTTPDIDPAFSPDGTKIAFVGQRNNEVGQPANPEIYVANNDGDLGGPDLTRLTFNDGTLALPPGLPPGLPSRRSAFAATDRQPSWSPDGKEIVFHSGRETSFAEGTTPAVDVEIYKMSATEGERGSLTRLTTSRGQDSIPTWSPDGTKIAFQSARVTNSFFNLEVFTMNPDGSGVTNVTNSPGTPDDPATAGREDSDAIDRDAAWSPDSSQLAFTSTRDNEVPGNQNFEIYKANRDGTNPVRLTLNASGDTPEGEPYQDYDAVPTFSPDGKRVLFISSRTSKTNDGEAVLAFTMDAQAGEAAGLQALVEIGGPPSFTKCDWQALNSPGTTPGGGGGGGGGGETGGGSGGGDAPATGVAPGTGGAQGGGADEGGGVGQGGDGVALVGAERVRARRMRRCMRAVARRHPLGSLRRGSRAYRRAVRLRRVGRRRCVRRFGRTPGRVVGLGARAASKTKVVLSFRAPGTDGARGPAARSYLVKQSTRPIRDRRGFRRAQTLCKGSCRFPVTRVGSQIKLTVTDLRPNTTYFYAIAARDNVSRRLGPRSQTVRVRTK
jgi:Tol biopolymer transport system component